MAAGEIEKTSAKERQLSSWTWIKQVTERENCGTIKQSGVFSKRKGFVAVWVESMHDLR